MLVEEMTSLEVVQLEQIIKLQTKLDKAIAVLEFYGEYGNHVMPKDASTNLTSIDVDGGTVAAKCLEEINNKES